jgi:hypothetical protein
VSDSNPIAVLEAVLIARPRPTTWAGKRNSMPPVKFLRGSDETQPLQLVFAGDPSAHKVSDFDARETGGVFFLEVQTAGNAGCSARGGVGTSSFPQATGEVGIAAGVVNRHPCLIISGAGLQVKERCWLHSFESLGGEIVELDVLDGLDGAWSDNNIVFQNGRFFQQFRHHPTQPGIAEIPDVTDLRSGRASPAKVVRSW